MTVMTGPAPRRRRTTRALTALGATILAAGLAACGSSSPAPGNSAASTPAVKTVAQSDGGPLVVWVDATRLPAAKLYAKSHPDVQLKIVTYDGDANGSGTLKTKAQLFNRVGKGWPDVVFTQDNTDMAWAATAPINFAATLDSLVPKETVDGFAAGALDYCKVGGRLVCLRNDLAQNVLWYDATLMKQFGYDPPKTWQDYAALGKKVAQEHPGYIIGTIGDSWGAFDYLWPNQCPASQLTGDRTVKIDLEDAACTDMAKLLDPLIANKSISVDTVFSPGFSKNQAGKLLALVGPAWYGSALFRDTLKLPQGRIAAAPPLEWEGRTPTTTGDVGGGLWIVSAHSAHLKQAADMVTWLATSNENQVQNPGYPAYSPAATAWLAAVRKSGYFANDIGPALQAAAGQVWDGWSPTTYNVSNIYANTVVPLLTKGSSLSDALGPFQQKLRDYAQAAGYQVEG
jgi:ABC-type glycerol-3-phosphate transport system substrate-binding protein